MLGEWREERSYLKIYIKIKCNYWERRGHESHFYGQAIYEHGSLYAIPVRIWDTYDYVI